MLILDHCWEKTFLHGKKPIQEFWIFLDPSITKGKIDNALGEAWRQFNLLPPKEK